MTPVQRYNDNQRRDLDCGGHRVRVMEENYYFLRDSGISHVISLQRAGFTEEQWVALQLVRTYHPVEHSPHLEPMQHSDRYRRSHGIMDEELDCE